MMIRLSALAILASSVTAYEPFSLGSKAGRKLFSKAKEIEKARHLDNNDRDVTFLHKYNIKYLGCTDLVQVSAEQGGEEGILYTQHLVKFALCPGDESNNCASCSGGGQYVVDMMEFVDSYTEAKLTEQEYKCEMIRENCYCNGYNDDEACENNCYNQAGMPECIEYEGQEEFEIQRYLECAEMENQNGNNNNNQNYYQNGNNNNNFYGQYYIAPYCAADGESIFLGVFYDEQCMNQADTSVYADKNYGMSLPYSSQPLVELNDCIPCKDMEKAAEQDYNNNNNGNNGNNNNNYYYEQEYEITEFCEQSYEMAARCETNMAINYKDTTGCTFINDILPRMESASRPFSSKSTGASSKTATVFAWLFGISTVLFGAYAYFLYRKIKRGSVNLSSQEGAMA